MSSDFQLLLPDTAVSSEDQSELDIQTARQNPETTVVSNASGNADELLSYADVKGRVSIPQKPLSARRTRSKAIKPSVRHLKGYDTPPTVDDEQVNALDTHVEELTEDEESAERERKKSRWSRVEAIVGAESRLQQVAADIVQHFENRISALDGKGMIVGMSRRICVALYNDIIRLRPDWHSTNDMAGAVKIVMTGNIASDPSEWLQHTGSRAPP